MKYKAEIDAIRRKEKESELMKLWCESESYSEFEMKARLKGLLGPIDRFLFKTYMAKRDRPTLYGWSMFSPFFAMTSSTISLGLSHADGVISSTLACFVISSFAVAAWWLIRAVAAVETIGRGIESAERDATV